MYIALSDALKIMAFLVAVSLLLVHQLCVAEIAIVGKLSLPPSVAKYLLALYDCKLSSFYEAHACISSKRVLP